MTSQLPIAIVGGGISGLSCAFYLNKFCKPLLGNRKIYIIEASKKTGGWLRSRRFEDGVIHELGPRSIRCTEHLGINTINLAEELGLGDEMIGTPANSPAAKKRLIYMNGDLIKLPSGLWDILKPMHPFNKSFFHYMMDETRRPRTYFEPDGDMSVHEFIVRRFDPQFAELLADPFCRGITAGNSRKLSLRSMFPVIFNAHEKAGSIVTGMTMFKNKLLPKEPFIVEKGDLFKSTRKRSKRWTSFNFKNGLSTFPEGFEKHFDQLDGQLIEIIKDAIVDSIEFDKMKGTAKVTAVKDQSIRTLEVAHVFSSIAPHNLSTCLKPTSEDDDIIELKSLLNKIKSVDVAVVTLEFEGKETRLLMPGLGSWCHREKRIYGYLVSRLIHVSFKSMTVCMMGGHWFENIFGPVEKVDWSKVVSIAVEESQKTLKFKKDPIRYTVRVNQKCIPQYEVFHHRLLRQIVDKSQNVPLDIIGAAFAGISVNDVILNARRAVHYYNERMMS